MILLGSIVNSNSIYCWDFKSYILLRGGALTIRKRVVDDDETFHFFARNDNVTVTIEQ
jgi:hypothetical protein